MHEHVACAVHTINVRVHCTLYRWSVDCDNISFSAFAFEFWKSGRFVFKVSAICTVHMFSCPLFTRTCFKWFCDDTIFQYRISCSLFQTWQERYFPTRFYEKQNDWAKIERISTAAIEGRNCSNSDVYYHQYPIHWRIVLCTFNDWIPSTTMDFLWTISSLSNSIIIIKWKSIGWTLNHSSVLHSSPIRWFLFLYARFTHRSSHSIRSDIPVSLRSADSRQWHWVGTKTEINFHAIDERS